MHRSLLILLFSALLVAGGCGGGKASEDEMAKRVRTATLSEDQALEKAKAAVRQNDSFADSAEYEITPTGTSGWTVTVNGSNGEFRLIVLDDAGVVLKYQGG